MTNEKKKRFAVLRLNPKTDLLQQMIHSDESTLLR